ncbi:hypothetical protein GCM10010313_46670 [Streptomyces violarus]|nr:hypothetical protein GCM10010313_46670 [Streptomyces violarus]
MSRTISRGSGRGIGGTCTSPAPSRPRDEEPAPEPELRTDTERLVDLPDRERERRPDTERRDFDDWDDVRELRLLERELPLVPEPPLPPAVMPVGGEATMPPPEGGPPAATTGARPQVSQYISPPPTSS